MAIRAPDGANKVRSFNRLLFQFALANASSWTHICQGVPGTKHQISGGTVYLIKGLDKLLQLALQDGKISSKLGEHGEYR